MQAKEMPPANGARPIVGLEFQEHLVAATKDLGRLQSLLDDSHDALQAGFFGLIELLQGCGHAGSDCPSDADGASANVASAVKALQLQDMATQLITHTCQRLQQCSDRLSPGTSAGVCVGAATARDSRLSPNPVSQSEMNTGFIELF
jgi:hypothetical protein